MIEGVDAYGHPDPHLLLADGKRFVMCYLKDTSRSQVDDYLAAGVDVGLIDETTGDAAAGGRTAGVRHGQTALVALDALQVPGSVAVYCAEGDSSAITGSQAAAFMGGYASVVGHDRAGWYGGRATVLAVQAAKVCRWLWQTYAWSGHPTLWVPGVHLQQYENHAATYGGVVVDFDRATVPDFGQWTSTPGDDMSAADVAAINAHTDAVIQRTFASLSHGTLPDSSTRNGVGHDQILAAIAALDLPPLTPDQIKQVSDAVSAAVTTAVAAELAKLVLVPKV